MKIVYFLGIFLFTTLLSRGQIHDYKAFIETPKVSTNSDSLCLPERDFYHPHLFESLSPPCLKNCFNSSGIIKQSGPCSYFVYFASETAPRKVFIRLSGDISSLVTYSGKIDNITGKIACRHIKKSSHFCIIKIYKTNTNKQ